MTYSPGLVSGDETMKATTGAHGTADARAPSTTAVVPHEQKGVSAPSATAPRTARGGRARSHPASRSVPTKTWTTDARTTLTSR